MEVAEITIQKNSLSLLERPLTLMYFLKVQAMCDTIEQVDYHLYMDYCISL